MYDRRENYYRRRIRDSFLSLVFGWFASFLLILAFVTIYTVVEIVRINVTINELLSVSDSIGNLMGLWFIFVAASLGSALISFSGWVLLGIPLSLLISDRILRNVWIVVVLHIVATIAASAITGAVIVSVNATNFVFSLWGYVGMLIGAFSGFRFWKLNNESNKT